LWSSVAGRRRIFVDLEGIRGWVEGNRRAILDLNRELVSIPSENRCPEGDEAAVQRLVERVLSHLGCETDVFLPTDVPGIEEHPAYLSGRSYEGRPNVVGRRRGTGGGRSILFSGHADTVPHGEDRWTVDPFSGEVRDGRQYGLGIQDMKGGMAAAMMALRCLNELDVRLAGDVTIEMVVDEEFGGANGTLACRLRGYGADIAVVPEPSNMVICPEAQGGGMYRVTFSGRPGRAFGGEELSNPVYAAARFLDIFRRYEEHHAAKKADSKWYAEDPGLPAYVQGVRAGFGGLEYTDRVPSRCEVDLWIQVYPGTTEEELTEDLTGFYREHAKDDEVLSKTEPRFERLIRYLPGSGIPEGHGIVGVAREASRAVLGEALPVRGAPFACDSFMFNLYSETPALIWGPRGGNAHAPDEYIEVEPFMDLVKTYALTIAEWCGVQDGE
jgi:acetylornithine deacetylase